MEERLFDFNIQTDQGPFVGAAIHDGHAIRENLRGRFKISDQKRLHEEDPYTGEIARQFDNYIIALHSRFEVDLNRPAERAVYKEPADAWGLDLWKEPLSEEEVAESMQIYHDFYQQLEEKLSPLVDAYGYVVVYDIHSYNYRREGPDAPPADPAGNPDVDVLTTNLHLNKWQPVLDKFMEVLQTYPYPRGKLDVRTDVRFDGNASLFMQWLIDRYQEKVFVPSIEIKKIFMDEWTGQLDHEQLAFFKKAIRQSLHPMMEEIKSKQIIPQTHD